MGCSFRRFFRYAFHAAAGFSALALVACLILWPRSYHRTIDLGCVTSGGSVYGLRVREGRLWVQYALLPWLRPVFACGFAPLDPGYADWSYTDWKHEGFTQVGGTCDRALGGEWWRGPVHFSVAIPLLYLTLLSAILPAFWLRWFRRERQARFARPGFPVEPAVPAR